MMSMPSSFIPYGRQDINAEDIEAVTAALSSDYLTSGPRIEEFENAFAGFVGARYAVAVCNATSALHLAMRVVDAGPGDRVVTSPNTFLSSRGHRSHRRPKKPGRHSHAHPYPPTTQSHPADPQAFGRPSAERC